MLVEVDARTSTAAASPPAGAAEVEVDVRGGIATLWLNRPAKRNAVTFEMWHAVEAACATLALDPAVRVLVVRGAGEHFCAGADIAGLAEADSVDYRQANEAADRALAAFGKPTIAFIQGACVGGGTEIAVACDLRIADTTARFGITPARLGIVYPGFALERVVRLIGPAAAKHLLFSAEIVDAERALRVGLIDELHAPAVAVERLDELTSRLADERSLLTQMASKAMVDEVAETGHVSAALERAWGEEVAVSADRAEGIAAFLERRSPRFTWTPSR